MCKFRIYFCIIYFVFSYCEVTEAFSMFGPLKKLEILGITECDPPLDTELSKKVNITTELKDLGEGKKSFGAIFSMPFDLDDSVNLNLVFRKWADGGWKDNSYKYQGKSLPEEVKSHIPKLYERLRISAIPEVPKGFPVAAGTYEIKDMTAKASDLNIPGIMYGRFLIHLTLHKQKEAFMCKELEINSQPA